MSKADQIFVNMCQDILDNGFSTEGMPVRPHWEDGTPAHTIKNFGVVNRYNLAEEFPALTLRPTAIKLATDELLWIWQRKSNNIKDLNSHLEFLGRRERLDRQGVRLPDGNQIQIQAGRDGPGRQRSLVP